MTKPMRLPKGRAMLPEAIDALLAFFPDPLGEFVLAGAELKRFYLLDRQVWLAAVKENLAKDLPANPTADLNATGCGKTHLPLYLHLFLISKNRVHDGCYPNWRNAMLALRALSLRSEHHRPAVPLTGPSPDSPLYSDVCNGDGRKWPRDYPCHHGKRRNDCDLCLADENQPGR